MMGSKLNRVSKRGQWKRQWGHFTTSSLSCAGSCRSDSCHYSQWPAWPGKKERCSKTRSNFYMLQRMPTIRLFQFNATFSTEIAVAQILHIMNECFRGAPWPDRSSCVVICFSLGVDYLRSKIRPCLIRPNPDLDFEIWILKPCDCKHTGC